MTKNSVESRCKDHSQLVDIIFYGRAQPLQGFVFIKKKKKKPLIFYG